MMMMIYRDCDDLCEFEMSGRVRDDDRCAIVLLSDGVHAIWIS